MATQFNLDFTQRLPPEAQARIADGMQQADDNANPYWRHIFDGCVLAAARRLPEVTSDDVLEEIEKLPNAPKTHNLVAIGPAMKRAYEMGILSATEKVLRSKRKEKKGNYHKVWKSNYFTKEKSS